MFHTDMEWRIKIAQLHSISFLEQLGDEVNLTLCLLLKIENGLPGAKGTRTENIFWNFSSHTRNHMYMGSETKVIQPPQYLPFWEHLKYQELNLTFTYEKSTTWRVDSLELSICSGNLVTTLEYPSDCLKQTTVYTDPQGRVYSQKMR